MSKIQSLAILAGKSLIILIILMAIMQGIAGAQAIGTSHIVMAQNSSTIYQNSSLAIPFSVNLTSGSSGTVSLVINNSQILQSKGIFIGLNKSTGIPNLTDTLFVNTNFDAIATPGVYNIEIGVGGADPLNPEFYNFTLTVLNVIKPTTTATTTVPSGVNTTIISATQSSSATEKDIGIVFGVALVIIIILFIIDKIRS